MVRRVLALLLALAAAAGAAPPAAPPPPQGVVSGRFVLPDRPPWAGEVFALRFVWQVDWEVFRYLDGDLGWTADPLATEGWTREPLGAPRPQGGRTVADLGFATRAIARTPGSVPIQPASQQMQIATGSYETSGVTIATIGPVLARSAAASVKVRPLPPAPRGFSGAVGDFILRSSLDTASFTVGKPIAWTVELSGTGNWMGFAGVPSRPLPRAFDLAGAPEPAAPATAGLFERSVAETITIVPRKAGAFTLGPVTMTVFDPDAGRYRTISAPAVRLVVAPGAAVAPARPAPGPAADESRNGGTDLPPALAGVGHARAPLPGWAWSAVLALPLVMLSLLWLGLATHRALMADPDRAARRADARLRRTLAGLATVEGVAARRALVRDWQYEAGVRLGLGVPVPTPASVGHPDWAQLWEEADHHLYAFDAPLPPDWPVRAAAVLARTAAPARFDPRQIFTAANLFPVAMLLCLVLVGLPRPLAATATPRPQSTAPLDWIGHYNHGRLAAIEKDWPTAATQAGIAWVQAPRSPEATALWVRVAREAGVGGHGAGGLPVPTDLRDTLTGLLPPVGWQLVTVAATLMVCGGYGTVLLIRFGHAPRRARALAVAAAAIGTIGSAIGGAGVAGYGPAAARDAAIAWRQVALRPLPVDSPDADARVIIPAGTVGHRDGAFIGWSRFTLADGRSGWVRRGELVAVWEAQS